MCGIAGIFHLDGQSPDLKILKAMIGALRHRGPDDEGFYHIHSLALAHRRLSILDLSPAGHQPMCNHRGDLWIVFNGEIYNYLELRQELSALGYVFQTHTDTEVILAAYEHFGTDCLQKFNGMWAFALWDQRKQTLFCSRDRFGIKPFYYFVNAAFFAFASEPKALLQHPLVPNTPSEAAIYTFLMTGVSNQKDFSFFKHIHQLPAGHYLWIEKSGIQLHPYWDLSQAAQAWSDAPPAQAKDIFLTLFEDSIRLRLRSDVPIGTCLSGGLDSSSIVCTAYKLLQTQSQAHYQQETFSSCFDNPRYDERPFIHKVLDKTGARANFLFPSPEKLQAELERLVYTQDEPFSSLSIFAQWCVMQCVKEKGVKVLLDGQGSDEMLGGYGYDGVFWAELFYSGQWQALYQELKAQFKRNPRLLPRRLARMLFPRGLPLLKQGSAASHFLNPEWMAVYQSQLHIESSERYPWQLFLKNKSYHLMSSSLLPLLRYEDRNSMAFSIEARLPFLDYRLVSFVFHMSSTQYIHQGWSKWILRQAMEGILPEEVRWRQDKMGFVTPQELWLRDELKPLVQEILHDPGFLSRPYWLGRKIQKAYQAWIQGSPSPLQSVLWPLLSTELWLRQFVDQRPGA